MRKKLTGYDVGALLYCPANAHTSIVDALVEQRFPTPFSLAFCLEVTPRAEGGPGAQGGPPARPAGAAAASVTPPQIWAE